LGDQYNEPKQTLLTFSVFDLTYLNFSVRGKDFSDSKKTGTEYSVTKNKKLCNITVNMRYTEYLNIEDEVFNQHVWTNHPGIIPTCEHFRLWVYTAYREMEQNSETEY